MNLLSKVELRSPLQIYLYFCFWMRVLTIICKFEHTDKLCFVLKRVLEENVHRGEKGEVKATVELLSSKWSCSYVSILYAMSCELPVPDLGYQVLHWYIIKVQLQDSVKSSYLAISLIMLITSFQKYISLLHTNVNKNICLGTATFLACLAPIHGFSPVLSEFCKS